MKQAEEISFQNKASKQNHSEKDALRGYGPTPSLDSQSNFTFKEGQSQLGQTSLIYKQELKRSIRPFMSFMMCFTNAAIIPTIFMQLEFGLKTGGPIVLLYGWLVVGLFSMIVAAVMGEICSTYPVAGSVYYWAGVLAKREKSPLFSFITGWVYFYAYIGMLTSFAYCLSRLIFALFESSVMNIKTGELEAQHASEFQKVLVSILILAIGCLSNIRSIDDQGSDSVLGGIIQISGIFIVVISIIFVSPHLSSSSFVFTHFENRTGFNPKSTFQNYYVSFLGLLTSLYAFAGYEGAATLAEETIDPHVNAPKGVFLTAVISFIMGLIIILAILYGCQDNIDFILSSHGPNVPSNLFYLVCSGNIYCVKGMGGLIILITLISGLSGITVASRIIFSMCRDGAFPQSEYLKQVNAKTRAPFRIILLLFILSSAFSMLPLASSTAFTAILQISTITIQICYIIPIYLRLTHSKNSFKQNSGFNLGKWSKLLGWIAFFWLCFSSLMCMFPTEIDPAFGITLKNFNYTPVVIFLFFSFIFVFWNLRAPYGAKHHFYGPKFSLSEEEKPLYDANNSLILGDSGYSQGQL